MMYFIYYRYKYTNDNAKKDSAANFATQTLISLQNRNSQHIRNWSTNDINILKSIMINGSDAINNYLQSQNKDQIEAQIFNIYIESINSNGQINIAHYAKMLSVNLPYDDKNLDLHVDNFHKMIIYGLDKYHLSDNRKGYFDRLKRQLESLSSNNIATKNYTELYITTLKNMTHNFRAYTTTSDIDKEIERIY